MSEYNQSMRVYIEDTDCGGIVYHANYLKYMERARSDFMRKYGYEHTSSEKEGFILVVASLSLNFKASAKMDDLIDVGVKITKVSSSSVIMEQLITRNGQLLVSGEIKIASIATSSGKLCSMSETLKTNLKLKLAE